VCAKGTTVKGIDVSSYQGTVSWTKVRASGRVFAFARVSDGNNTIDKTFATNWPGMRSAGIIRGAYQYFRPSQDATKQADLLISKINAAGGLKAGDLPPTLDFETSSGLAASTAVARAKTWLARVESKLGVKPIIYSGANMSSVTGSHFKNYLLWAPNYGATCPSIATGWSNWTFWQNSDKGSVSGVSGAVDTNLFNGSLDQLKLIAFKANAAVDPVIDAGVVDSGVGVDSGVAIDSGISDPDSGAGDTDSGAADGGVEETPAIAPRSGDLESVDISDDQIEPSGAKENDGSDGAAMNDSHVAKEAGLPPPASDPCSR
jgi:lysozyme